MATFVPVLPELNKTAFEQSNSIKPFFFIMKHGRNKAKNN